LKIDRALLWAGAIVLLFAIPASTLLPAQTGTPTAKAVKQPIAAASKAAHRVALPINSEDATVMKQVLSTALHLSFHYQSRRETFSMEIVGYSAGVHMFRADTSPVREQLIKLLSVNPNVRFVICEATKLGMERVEGKPVPLFEKVDLVPNGPAHIIDLQEGGWSYIRT
jgi:intracellular sulfur oxidation DsrE/DsrF family protein